MISNSLPLLNYPFKSWPTPISIPSIKWRKWNKKEGHAKHLRNQMTQLHLCNQSLIKLLMRVISRLMTWSSCDVKSLTRNTTNKMEVHTRGSCFLFLRNASEFYTDRWDRTKTYRVREVEKKKKKMELRQCEQEFWVTPCILSYESES